jgi:hypothetical protein
MAKTGDGLLIALHSFIPQNFHSKLPNLILDS